MLLKYLGTKVLASVEDGFGSSLTVNPGDVIYVNPDIDLDDKYPSLFEKVTHGTTLIQKRVSLTSAQIKALNTTPITLLPAPGAGKFIDVDSVALTLDYGSAAYETNTTLELRYTDGSGAKVTADVADLLAATADKAIIARGVATELVPVANAPVIIKAASGNPATGDSPVYVTINYRILDLP